MTIVVPGKGLMAAQRTEYIGGQPVHVIELGVADDIPSTIDARVLGSFSATEGQILVSDGFGNVKWEDPFDSDKELREKYPALEESWGVLMEALTEYRLVKKLVQDYDK